MTENARRNSPRECIFLYNLIRRSGWLSSGKPVNTLRSHGNPFPGSLVLFLALWRCRLLDWYIRQLHGFPLRFHRYRNIWLSVNAHPFRSERTIASLCNASNSACTASSSSGLIRDCNVSSISYSISLTISSKVMARLTLWYSTPSFV
jgi:hypothetical protein